MIALLQLKQHFRHLFLQISAQVNIVLVDYLYPFGHNFHLHNQVDLLLLVFAHFYGY